MVRFDMGARSDTALLLVDVIHPFDFPGADALLGHARQSTLHIRELAARFRELALPVIYVNDNFGRWRSNFHEIVEYCAQRSGRDVVSALHPEPSDYFMLKPHRSGFYCTALELLLSSLGVRHVVLAGWSTDMCIFATASDAQMRKLATTLVRDGTAALSALRHERALALLEDTCDAQVVAALDLMRDPRAHPAIPALAHES
jgi:nicotinamidase-related amidase